MPPCSPESDYDIPCAQPQKHSGPTEPTVSPSSSTTTAVPDSPPVAVAEGKIPSNVGTACNLQTCSACSLQSYVEMQVKYRLQAKVYNICPFCDISDSHIDIQKNPYNLIVPTTCQDHSKFEY